MAKFVRAPLPDPPAVAPAAPSGPEVEAVSVLVWAAEADAVPLAFFVFLAILGFGRLISLLVEATSP